MTIYRVFTVTVEGVELDVMLDTSKNAIPVVEIFPVHDEINILPIMSKAAIDQAQELAAAEFWKGEPGRNDPEQLPCGWRDAA